ncbi:hypothetical protein [Alkalibaculum bacchi]|uniref:hypothetical protein n=1 Tax=Alkalibaculum bacchi TaxID=645887 RepID=UPI0026EC249D|nr:hypothetical protein [Alkalibaculum bacchi]
MKEKKNIFYSRTYRHLENRLSKGILYMFVLVIPVLLIFILNIKNITVFMSELAIYILSKEFKGVEFYKGEDHFSILGNIEFVSLPTVYPEILFVLLNIILVLSAVIFLNIGKKRGGALSIYFTAISLIHIINCIYFIFASDFFPYTGSEYSNLYMKQQISIWISFIVMAGLITGFVVNKGVIYKIVTFFSIVVYSLAFGIIRYIVFLYIVQKFSILYMVLLFFILGPFFDFLYFVTIYGLYINKMTKLLNNKLRGEEWLWS